MSLLLLVSCSRYRSRPCRMISCRCPASRSWLDTIAGSFSLTPLLRSIRIKGGVMLRGRFLKGMSGNPEGRFKPGLSGNPAGRPPGSRNKATETAELLLEGEAVALTRKAVELALGGDPIALRLCLDRLIPPRRGRKVQLANVPPVSSVAELGPTMAAITTAATTA